MVLTSLNILSIISILCLSSWILFLNIANKKLRREFEKHKMADKTIQISEKRFRDIIEDVAEISIQGYDEDHRVIFWNPASEKLYGYSEKEASGKKLEELIIPPKMREQVNGLIQRWLQHGVKIPAGEIDLIDKKGNTVSVFSSHVMLETPQGKEMFCIDINLNPIRRTEEALRTSEELLKAIFDTAKDSIFIKDNELKYKKVNQAMERLLKKNAGEIIDKTDRELFGMETGDRAMKIDQRALEGETVEEITTKHFNNEMRYFHTIKVPLKNPSGKITGICGIARDITARKQAEEEKITARKIAAEHEKFALVGRIAGKMAHDFNNILGVIMGNTELALLDCRDDETIKTLELIFEQTLRGKNLTKNLIVFAKDQEPKQEFFRINDKIDLIINLLKNDFKGVELLREENNNLPELFADPGMIEHALVNLIQNAIHATGKSENPGIIFRTYLLDENICFEIEDNGCGIPEKYLEKIYEPAFTLKGNRDLTGSYKADVKGIGYGLANVKKYIEQHKGTISIESDLNKGTKAIVSLPLIQKNTKRL